MTGKDKEREDRLAAALRETCGGARLRRVKSVEPARKGKPGTSLGVAVAHFFSPSAPSIPPASASPAQTTTEQQNAEDELQCSDHDFELLILFTATD